MEEDLPSLKRKSTLPLLVSLPHAGLEVPEEVGNLCVLSPSEVEGDSDEGAEVIYAPLASRVAAFVTTEVARAIVDMNRAEDDRSRDGVIKTRTCWDVPVYAQTPSGETIRTMIEKYHRPYHEKLEAIARSGVRAGVDCHTMAGYGPPVGPDPGRKRPPICLSDGDGTCPKAWMDALVACFEKAFRVEIAVNHPFKGGHIIRSHASELPWVQVELSREPYLTLEEKGRGVLRALTEWCRLLGL